MYLIKSVYQHIKRHFTYFRKTASKSMRISKVIPECVVHMATSWKAQGSNSGGGEIFRTRPERPGPETHPPICRVGTDFLSVG